MSEAEKLLREVLIQHDLQQLLDFAIQNGLPQKRSDMIRMFSISREDCKALFSIRGVLIMCDKNV